MLDADLDVLPERRAGPRAPEPLVEREQVCGLAGVGRGERRVVALGMLDWLAVV